MASPVLARGRNLPVPHLPEVADAEMYVDKADRYEKEARDALRLIGRDDDMGAAATAWATLAMRAEIQALRVQLVAILEERLAE
jgi:hypothetical protein